MPDLPPTERRNPRTTHLDRMSTRELLEAVNAEDRLVADAVAGVLPQVELLVGHAVRALRSGGSVHYLGAGTSGRLAVLDAVELRPTFDAPAHWFVPHLAGGPQAMTRAVEGAEDDAQDGARVVQASVSRSDLVVGVAASGRTPWVLAGLRAARDAGAVTALVCADPQAPAGREVDVLVGVGTGPEVVTGSTRMKAGTAQKLVLNALSTAVMVRMGRTWSNLMVGLVATNDKLRERSLRILAEATGAGPATCRQALDEAGGELRVALVRLLSGAGTHEAVAALESGDGQVARALELLGGADGSRRG